MKNIKSFAEYSKITKTTNEEFLGKAISNVLNNDTKTGKAIETNLHNYINDALKYKNYKNDDGKKIQLNDLTKEDYISAFEIAKKAGFYTKDMKLTDTQAKAWAYLKHRGTKSNTSAPITPGV